MKDLISIIVPVYGVEKYLDKCIQSIVDQSHQNLEIILVDDGSPDNCPRMCDQWAQKDGRIRVIHQENGGLASARNRGLEIATGAFIGFVDSDDFIYPQMYEVLYTQMMADQSQVARCDVLGFDEGEHIRSEAIVQPSAHCYQNVKGREISYWEKQVGRVVWNKLYSRSILQNVRFIPNVRYAEDIPFSIEIYCRVKKVSYVAAPMYYYLRRKDSILRAKNAADILQSIELFECEWEKNKDRVGWSVKMQATMLDLSAHMLMEPQLYTAFDQERQKQAHQIVRKHLKWAVLCSIPSILARINAVVVYVSPSVAQRLGAVVRAGKRRICGILRR